jgi:hypothetical protein
MTELNGTLQGIGLPQLLSFLEGLRSTGSLLVEDGPWTGALVLTEGQLAGAQFGAEQGLSALDAILLALPRGRFRFSSAIESCEVNIVLKPGALTEHLETIARESDRLMAAVPSLSAVPYVLETSEADGEEGEITLGQRALRLLLALDGRRNVALLARERGMLHTLRELAELTQLGLIGMNGHTEESASLDATATGVARLPAHAAEEAPEDEESALEPPATPIDRGLRAGLEARNAEAHRRMLEPHAKSTDPARNGAANPRRFWH